MLTVGASTVGFYDVCSSVSLVQSICSEQYGFSGAIVEEANRKDALNNTVGVVAWRKTVTVPSKNASFDQVKSGLIAAREDYDIVALSCDNEYIMKRLLETELNLVDVLSVNLETISALKPQTVRMIVKQGIMFEFQVSQLLVAKEREKCLTSARHVIRTFVRRSKTVPNLLLSTGARTEAGLRTVLEMQAIGMLLGLRPADACATISSSVRRLLSSARGRRRRYNAVKDKALAQQTMSSYRKRPGDTELDAARKRLAVWSG